MQNTPKEMDIVKKNIERCSSKKNFIKTVMDELSPQDKTEFYPNVCVLLKYIGFSNPYAVREGDTNCRFDAVIIDSTFSIPIEIKSPRECMEISIKSIRQAFENKVVLLSRKFYPTHRETSSLSIAFNYPPARSDVYELIENIKGSYKFNIGIIDVYDLLNLVYDVVVEKKKINWNYLNSFCGKISYENVFSKK
jgi:hypothetical protein